MMMIMLINNDYLAVNADDDDYTESMIINAEDDGSQVTCCYAFMLPVACPTNAIVYKASGFKIMMIMIMLVIKTKYFLASSIL